MRWEEGKEDEGERRKEECKENDERNAGEIFEDGTMKPVEGGPTRKN